MEHIKAITYIAISLSITSIYLLDIKLVDQKKLRNFLQDSLGEHYSTFYNENDLKLMNDIRSFNPNTKEIK